MIYDLLLLVFVIAYLPVFLIRGKPHPGFLRRLGSLPGGRLPEKPIWIHAVSVGEAALIRPMVEELRRSFPGAHFVFSTVTPTGNKVIAALAQEGDIVTYLPLDFRIIVRKVFAAFDPRCLVIVETELWPNFITEARRRGIPVIVVNGRISDSAFGRYRLVKGLLKPMLDCVSLFCMQSARDRKRILELSADPVKVKVTGNMKFDIPVKCPSGGVEQGRALFTAASTHAGEEEVVLEAFGTMRQRFPGLGLLIAPRHPQRSAEVEALVQRAGFASRRVSALSGAPAAVIRDNPGCDVFILDMVGRLMDFYAVSSVVFVGGSLVRIGGHNILEPASLGKPVIIGPHMSNFRDIASLFIENRACVTVRDGMELAAQAARLLGDPSAVEALTASATRILDANRGAALRTCAEIKNVLSATRV